MTSNLEDTMMPEHEEDDRIYEPDEPDGPDGPDEPDEPDECDDKDRSDLYKEMLEDMEDHAMSNDEGWPEPP
jgi:hypothetical protein